MHATVFDNKQE